MTRIGKIARLPHELREQLNRRLQDGEPGAELVGWLNELPEVQTVLAEHFAGRPITEQNLSEWKTGGYGDWLAHQQALEAVGRIAGEVDELESAVKDRSVTELLAQWLAARCLAAARAWAQKDPTDPEAMRQLRQLCQEAVRLGRLELQIRRVDTEENLLVIQVEKDFNELKRKRAREIEGAMRLYAMGLGPKPREWEEAEKAEGERRKAEGSGKSSAECGVRNARNPSQSDRIRPNPTTKEMAKVESRVANGEAKAKAPPPLTINHQLPNHQPNPRQSDRIQPNPTCPRRQRHQRKGRKGRKGPNAPAVSSSWEDPVPAGCHANGHRERPSRAGGAGCVAGRGRGGALPFI